MACPICHKTMEFAALKLLYLCNLCNKYWNLNSVELYWKGYEEGRRET